MRGQRGIVSSRTEAIGSESSAIGQEQEPTIFWSARAQGYALHAHSAFERASSQMGDWCDSSHLEPAEPREDPGCVTRRRFKGNDRFILGTKLVANKSINAVVYSLDGGLPMGDPERTADAGATLDLRAGKWGRLSRVFDN